MTVAFGILRLKRSVDDAVNMGLHYVLQHLNRPGPYMRIMFVDFSSAFNTIIPNLLLPKLTHLSIPIYICQWINRLPDRKAAASEAGKIHIQHPCDQPWSSSGLCSLPNCSSSLYTNDCTSKITSVKLLKFADKHHTDRLHPGR